MSNCFRPLLALAIVFALAACAAAPPPPLAMTPPPAKKLDAKSQLEAGQ
jgi:predicted small lipoprotein YifL